MDKYLTGKCRPGAIRNALENAALLLLAIALLLWLFVGISGFLMDGFVAVHIVMALAAVPFVLMLNRLTGMKRSRKHAEVLIAVLVARPDGSMTCEELEQLTGVRRTEQILQQLKAEGYITGVSIDHGVAMLQQQ